MRVVIHPARNRISTKSQNELGDSTVDFACAGNGGDSLWLRMHGGAPYLVRNRNLRVADDLGRRLLDPSRLSISEGMKSNRVTDGRRKTISTPSTSHAATT